MKDLETLRSKKTGYGHFRISITIGEKEYWCITSDTMAIDAAFDDFYDDEDHSGSYYESQEEARIALASEIESKNEIL